MQYILYGICFSISSSYTIASWFLQCNEYWCQKCSICAYSRLHCIRMCEAMYLRELTNYKFCTVYFQGSIGALNNSYSCLIGVKYFASSMGIEIRFYAIDKIIRTCSYAIQISRLFSRKFLQNFS